MHRQSKVGPGRAGGDVSTPWVWPHPRPAQSPSPCSSGLLAGPGWLPCWCSGPILKFGWALLLFCLNVPSWLRILLNFLTYAYKTCIYQNSWKMWVVNPNSMFWSSNLFYFVEMLVVELWVKNRQQAPPHLALCSSSSKVLWTKRVHLLDLQIRIQVIPSFTWTCELPVSTKISWVIEKWNRLDSNLLTLSLLRNLGFCKILKT